MRNFAKFVALYKVLYGKRISRSPSISVKAQRGVECLFPNRLWLRAEVSSIKARPGGHCWLDLSQSDDRGLVAKASAVVWSSKYRFLAPYFESVTGSPLQEGMVILVEIQVSYSQLYGLSLIINDIDPEYTLGLKELERQRTIARLQSEGLIGLQKELDLPVLPYRLAVISAEDAAGFRDFVKHLEENPYGFKMEVTLFPALMQGAECPGSIVSALDSVLESDEPYDLVLIMRGGGSKLDLACYDDYELSAVIAQFPLPVFTAIGHDQDYHVCDMVAYSYLKTPTALADELISIYEDEDAALTSFVSRIRLAAAAKISAAESRIDMLKARLLSQMAMKIAQHEAALKVMEARITAADPRRLLERGYVLALDGGGVVIKSAAGRKTGDNVVLMFPDGSLECTVDNVKL
jgi:exodeoxyribonuclease VII large subunit